jgi:Leucine-rich repeat (LRR) protein
MHRLRSPRAFFAYRGHILPLHRFGSLLGALISVIAFGFATTAHAAIPASERTYLIAFYNQTNGGSWTNKTGWLGAAGTECTWYGITCNFAGDHVVKIDLYDNGLTGSLPANLSALSELFLFEVRKNDLGGALPTINSMAKLSQFHVSANKFTGTIPALPSAITGFLASDNQLTGAIPSLSGLLSLAEFRVSGNQLTGSLPSLLGTPKIVVFDASDNVLTGGIPVFLSAPQLKTYEVAYNSLSGALPSLSGVQNLESLRLEGNQFNGFLPDLAGFTALVRFSAWGNNFTGTIPAINHITSLTNFSVSQNQLIGAIPSLSGLTNLAYFSVAGNKLTGTIPALTGLSELEYLFLQFNQLTGSIPSLDGLPLSILLLHGNQLTGPLPSAPATLLSDESLLCPNQLTPTANAAWDTATNGAVPWFTNCTTPRIEQSLSMPNLVSLFAGTVSGIVVSQNPKPGSSEPIVALDLTPTICTGTINAANTLGVSIPAQTRIGSICRIAVNKAGDSLHNAAPQKIFATLVTRSVDANLCKLDADGDGRLLPARDGVLLMRYLLGFRDNALTQGLSLSGLRTTGSAIANFLDTQNFNVDNAAGAPAGTRTMRNAIVIQRYFQALAPLLMVDKTGVGASGFTVLNNIEAWCPLACANCE